MRNPFKRRKPKKPQQPSPRITAHDPRLGLETRPNWTDDIEQR